MAAKKSDAELPIESVVAFAPRSNGEYMPAPPTERMVRAEQRWREIVEQRSKQLGMSRRAFARSACGIAASLLALNEVACGGGGGGGSGGGTGGTSGGSSSGGPGGTSGGSGSSGSSDDDSSGGFYDVNNETTGDNECAEELLYDPDAFVFDVQTHTQSPFTEAWGDADPPTMAIDYLKQIFVDGGTTVACITGIPAARKPGEGTVAAAVQLQEILDRIGGDRLRLHCNIDMNLAGELDYMQMISETFHVNAWKVYPYQQPWLANASQGGPFIDKARQLGITVIAAHRGITSNGPYLDAGSPRDLVEAASQHPDITFLTYHSGWERGTNENHPYDPDQAPEDVRGIDRMVRAMLEFDIPPNTGNVYAELGSTWYNLLADPAQAAHALGKLLLYVGEDRIIYGTDSVFNGTPAGQIAALRTFQIPEKMRETFGYPEITPEIRRKILGLNAAPVYDVDPMAVRCQFGLDEIEQLQMAYRYDPRSVDMPHPHKYLGPRNRREFFAFQRAAQRDERPV
jgi:predicted TIM-barrel fold metal-dependent hydrolase